MLILLFPNVRYHENSWWGLFPKRIAERAAEMGLDCKVLYMGANSPLPAHVSAETVSVGKLYDPCWCYRTIRRMAGDAERFVVHQHTVPIHTWLWPVCKLWGKRCRTVFTDHDPPNPMDGRAQAIKRVVKSTLQKTVYYPDWIVPVSQYNANVWASHFGSRSVKPIINGVDFPDQMRVKQAPQGGDWVFGYLGRLMEKKGIQPFLLAAKEVIAAGDSVRFVLAGSGPDEALIQSFINDNNVGGRIQFMGPTTDLKAYYSDVHALIVPSQYEDPCPLVSIEAMGYGVPAIYTRRGGLPETQVDGETGIMVERGTPEEIVSAIRRMICDPEVYERMSAAALRRARGDSRWSGWWANIWTFTKCC